MPERILYDENQIRKLLAELSDLRMRILRSSDYPADFAGFGPEVSDPSERESISNLRHYLAFRSRDLRPLQERLASIGLSSLGRSEVHVVDAIERALNLLRRLALPHLPPVGPERLAEVQEEILWLAEAAHLPVVWANQVLETMAKKGVVSRPELTDAAMGERAECVMLNKGPFIEKALKSLHDILSRMQEHQRKKSPRLRALYWGGNDVAGRG